MIHPHKNEAGCDYFNDHANPARSLWLAPGEGGGAGGETLPQLCCGHKSTGSSVKAPWDGSFPQTRSNLNQKVRVSCGNNGLEEAHLHVHSPSVTETVDPISCQMFWIIKDKMFSTTKTWWDSSELWWWDDFNGRFNITWTEITNITKTVV